MKGDFSRWRATNAAAQGYAGVLMQQGRLHTDADWNENLSIHANRSETALTDIIGACGTPKNEPGFTITSGAGGFSIGAGRFYIDGLLLENASTTSFDAQGGDDLTFPDLSTILADGEDGLIYLEATKVHITAQEDPLLADPALGGPDTATRIKAQWRVGIHPVDLTDAARADLIAHARCGHMPMIDDLTAGTGRMRAGTAPAEDLPDDADCLIPPEAGYLSQENQVYRVQIITGGPRSGARFVWSRENGSVQALLARNADGAFILRGDREDEALGFVSGGWVEVFDDHNTATGTTGQMTRITLVDGVATFAPNVANFDAMVAPRLRRWDHDTGGPSRMPLTSGPVLLEHGVQVAFTSGTYREGDHWMFEARAATGTVIWPQITGDGPNEAVPPMGWGRHYAPLALVRRNGNGLAPITDLRAMIPSLTCLQAEDVRFDDTVCNMGADTVQDAIEILCQRSGGQGLCTFVVGNARELIDTVASIRPNQSARICLRGAQFQLPRPVVFDGLGHITVEGTGPQSIVSVANGEAALLFRNCATVRVTDMSLSGGRTGTEPDGLRAGRLGVVTALNCSDVSVERVRLRCRAGLDRAAACVSTRNTSRRTRVLVRDCTMSVGQAQIGVNIIGAASAVVENNHLRPTPARAGPVFDRIIVDPVLVARMSRGLLWFTDSTPGNSGSVSILSATPDAAAGGEQRSLRSFRPAAERQTFALNGQRGSVTASIHTGVSTRLATAMRLNRAGTIADAAEMRAHLRNVMAEAIRNSGRAVVGSATRRILDLQILALPDRPFIGQGIVIAGDRVEHARITGNRIEDAVDGIRIAASSDSDPRPPRWRTTRPSNTVTSASVTDNRITVLPLSSLTNAHGIYFGHVDRITARGNTVTGQSRFAENFAPHYGMHQFGYRGAHLTWSENAVADLHFGLAVLPELADGLSGIWRLRDNSAFDTTNPYAVASGVQVI